MVWYHHPSFQTLRLFNSTHHFSELFLVDMMINEDFDPFVAEINMSPSLHPIFGQFFTEALEQLVYQSVQLVGAGSYVEMMSM